MLIQQQLETGFSFFFSAANVTDINTKLALIYT